MLNKNAILALFVILIGCKEDSLVQSSSSGTFKYMAYDTVGTLIVSGWMKIDIQDSTHVTRYWHFNKINNPRNIGTHTSEGKLVGGFENNQLHIDLNPDYRDNNVFLCGRMEDNIYKGTWTWCGFADPINRGSFQANRY
jgi:hypothetical protein